MRLGCGLKRSSIIQSAQTKGGHVSEVSGAEGDSDAQSRDGEGNRDKAAEDAEDIIEWKGEVSRG